MNCSNLLLKSSGLVITLIALTFCSCTSSSNEAEEKLKRHPDYQSIQGVWCYTPGNIDNKWLLIGLAFSESNLPKLEVQKQEIKLRHEGQVVTKGKLYLENGNFHVRSKEGQKGPIKIKNDAMVFESNGSETKLQRCNDL